MDRITPVILCGGSGTRLWPLSRKALPKPFLPLVGEASLFEATLARASDPALFAAPVVVAGEHASRTDRERSFPQARPTQVIVEPEGKNTAAAIALAAARLPDGCDDAGLPERPPYRRRSCLCRCRRPRPPGWRARAGWSPSELPRPGPRPATAISGAAKHWTAATGSSRFVEKPDLATAEGMAGRRRLLLERRDLRLPCRDLPRRTGAATGPTWPRRWRKRCIRAARTARGSIPMPKRLRGSWRNRSIMR